MARLKRQELLAEAARRNAALIAALGHELRRSRLLRRLTQARLGAIVGVVQSTVSQMERGRAGSLSMDVWQRAFAAVGRDLTLTVTRDRLQEPDDAGHLGIQELVLASHAEPATAVPSSLAHGRGTTVTPSTSSCATTRAAASWSWSAGTRCVTSAQRRGRRMPRPLKPGPSPSRPAGSGPTRCTPAGSSGRPPAIASSWGATRSCSPAGFRALRSDGCRSQRRQ
jgi:transcriptional regulator with XRE-family HTH domain